MSTEETQRRILNAAGAAFAKRGFKAATVREIARSAGVNLASINYHFGVKWRLYVETIKHAHRLKDARIPLPEWPPGTPPEAKLRDFVRTMLGRVLLADEVPWQARLMAREMLQPSGAVREVAEEIIRPNDDLLVAILSEMLPEGTPPHRVQQLVFSVVGQCVFYRVGRPIFEMLVPEGQWREHYTQAQLADHIADVILAALGREQVDWVTGPEKGDKSNLCEAPSGPLRGKLDLSPFSGPHTRDP